MEEARDASFATNRSSACVSSVSCRDQGSRTRGFGDVDSLRQLMSDDRMTGSLRAARVRAWSLRHVALMRPQRRRRARNLLMFTRAVTLIACARFTLSFAAACGGSESDCSKECDPASYVDHCERDIAVSCTGRFTGSCWDYSVDRIDCHAAGATCAMGSFVANQPCNPYDPNDSCLEQACMSGSHCSSQQGC